MDDAMLSDSISNILQWTNYLKADQILGNHINLLESSLKYTNRCVVTYAQKQSLFKWLQKVEDVVIDLNDLMNDLPAKETTGDLSTEERFKARFQVKKATQELDRLMLEMAREQHEEEEDHRRAIDNIKFTCKEYETLPMFGRENEKKEIIDQLLKPNNSDVGPVVIVIVGVSGIGKTKLADLVCMDDQVKAHFGSQPIWFNHLYFVNIPDFVTESQNKKSVLVVIDDFGNNDLDKLQQITEEVGGRTDMTILITTSSNKVADNIAARYVLRLQGLNQVESWSLFKDINHDRPVTATYEENVRDCGGIPLLIMLVVAGEMYTHRPPAGVATDVLTPEVIHLLKISFYNNLPSYQKKCFVYCSLFPEDYLIDAEKLIQLWTAEGFFLDTIPSNSDTIAGQQFGRACFDNFVPFVFHQAELENDHHKYCGVAGNNDLYRMNKLMHKFTKLLNADGENIIFDSMGKRVHGRMLRGFFNCALPDSMFEKAKKLTTILFPYNPNNPRLPNEVKMTTSTCNKIFNTFKRSLHTLDLNDLGIKMVPRSIEEVKDLRYLDLSHNNMEKLPSCITTLVHLQTLKLSQCHDLKELPKDMGNLSSLNHLDIEGCLRLTHMPSGISNLTDLQTLSVFVASKKHVSGGLRSLTNLNKLRGYLEISHLERVKYSPSKNAAKDDFLKNKQDLEFMTLRWDHKEDDKEEIDVKEEKSLECLEPHQNLKVLLIVGYNGYTLSNWLTSLQYLVKFTLNNCPKCQYLPPIDQLPHLKVLRLWRLGSMKFITTKRDQVGSSTPIFFPSLEELTILDCPNLESWWKDEKSVFHRPSFSCISKLNIQFCPRLVCMPRYPGLDKELVLVESDLMSITDTIHYAIIIESFTSQPKPFSKLKKMVIERIEHLPQGSNWFTKFISLEELHIRDCSNMTSLPKGFVYLTSLVSLSIERCEKLALDEDRCGIEWVNPTEMKRLKDLTSLTLRALPKLKYLSWGIEHLPSLKELRIYDCHGLTQLPETIGNLTSLEKLDISECRLLKSLPKGMASMKSLHSLSIKNCPLLLPRCQPDTGEDWPHIAHIKNIQVKQTTEDGM